MKSTLILAGACAVLLSACAAAPGGASTTATASGGTGTMYCWKRSLTTAGDSLVCNWESSAREACRSIAEVRMARASVAGEPRDAGRCDNGEWLVAVSTK